MIKPAYQVGDMVHIGTTARITRVEEIYSFVSKKELIEYRIKFPSGESGFAYEDIISGKVEFDG